MRGTNRVGQGCAGTIYTCLVVEVLHAQRARPQHRDIKSFPGCAHRQTQNEFGCRVYTRKLFIEVVTINAITIQISIN